MAESSTDQSPEWQITNELERQRACSLCMNKVDEFTEATITIFTQGYTKVKAVSVTGLQEPPPPNGMKR